MRINSRAVLMPRMNKPCGAGLFFSFCLACIVCQAQSLTPRAYVITPVQWNAFIVSYSFYDGSVLFDGAVPITGAKTRVNVVGKPASSSWRRQYRNAGSRGEPPQLAVLR